MNRIVTLAAAAIASFAVACSGSGDSSSSDQSAGALAQRGAVGGDANEAPSAAAKKVRRISGTFKAYDSTLDFELVVCPDDQSDIYRTKAWFRTTPKNSPNASPDDMILSSPRRYLSYEGYDAEGGLGYRLADPDGGFSTGELAIDQFEGSARKQVSDKVTGSVKDDSVEPSADLLKACKRSPLPLIKQ